MKITAPLSRVEEIAPLIAAGADELYCSAAPDDWLQQFGSNAVSRRLFSNLQSMRDLEEATQRVQGLGKHLSLVMNAQQYTAAQLNSLLRLAEHFAQQGGDALIVSDPTLLALIADEQLEIAVHLSSIATCRNRSSAAFFQDLGVDRIIFPRDMTFQEMHHLTAAYPELEFEAFVLNDGCVFEEGVCHSIHLPAQQGGAICMDNYRYQYRRIDNAPLSEQELSNLAENDSHYAKWVWYRFGCGFSVTQEGYPYGPCGLCAISRLRDMSVSSVKIAGRDAPTERKVKSVELVKGITEQLALGVDDQVIIQRAQSVRGDPELCSHGQMCYYPEVVREKKSTNA